MRLCDSDCLPLTTAKMIDCEIGSLNFTKLISLRPHKFSLSRFPTVSFSILHSSLLSLSLCVSHRVTLPTLFFPTLIPIMNYQRERERERTKPYYSQTTSWLLSSSISSQPQCIFFSIFHTILISDTLRHYRSLFQSHENFFTTTFINSANIKNKLHSHRFLAEHL